MRRAHRRDLSRPRHRRRGVRHRARRRRIRLGARPDRRHPRLHHRPAGVGNADRPDARRPAAARHDGTAVHRRAVRRRRQQRLVPAAGRRDVDRDPRRAPSLAEASLFTTSPALFSRRDRAAYDRVESAVRLARYGCDCYAYCMVAAGHADVVDRGRAPALRHRRADPDRRRRRRPGDRLGRQFRRPAAAAWWRPATARLHEQVAATGWPGLSASRARDEGVEGRPELLADRVALHQELVPAAGDDDRAAGPHARRRSARSRRSETTRSRAPASDQRRDADRRPRNSASAASRIARQAA